MSTIVFMLEEQSMEEMLRKLEPEVIPEGWVAQYIRFPGKQALEKQFVKKMKNWLDPESVFLIVRDQDAGDCRDIKGHLLELCKETGRRHYLVRIACRELESFYCGDLDAVAAAFDMPRVATMKGKKRFRDPDSMQNPKQELRVLTGNLYQPLIGSRLIASHMRIQINRSRSFHHLIDGIRRLTENQHWCRIP